jgi:hypothetical protein
LEAEIGYWQLHLEYPIRARYPVGQVDIISFPGVSNPEDSFYPRERIGHVYEIEPLDEFEKGLSDVRRYLRDLIRYSSYLHGATKYEHDWRQVEWTNAGIPAMPSHPEVILTDVADPDPGLILFWYEGQGVVLFAKSTWDDTRLIGIPEKVQRDLKKQRGNSIQVQQFVEMINRAETKSIPVDNWPVDSKYPAYLAWLAACAAAVRAASAYLGPGAYVPIGGPTGGKQEVK